LLLSALMRVPWHTTGPAAVSFGLLGLAGAVYSAVVLRLLALAIRNAWDGVAYHVFVNVVPRRAAERNE
jgi:hypothetical protein